MSFLAQFATFSCVVASILYLIFAVRCVSRFTATQDSITSKFCPPVTLLKPICGLDPDLYENLRSFCEQEYPYYQIIFGVSDPLDLSVPIIQRLLKEFSDLDLSLVIDDRVHGINPKINNLINMYQQSKYDWIIIADSDIRVDSNYLKSIVAPFENNKIGAVTCLYLCFPIKGIASRLSTLFINGWFLPSVLIANAIQKIRYCFGPTMAIRRDVLEQMGGFNKLLSVLADDYLLGKLTFDLGYQVHLSSYLVKNIVEEPNFKRLFLHELRWARTIYSVQPIGHTFSVIVHAIPVSLLFLAVAPSYMLGLTVVSIAITIRLLMHLFIYRNLELEIRSSDILLIPLRDLLTFIVWSVSFFGRSIQWRQHNFLVKANSQLVIKD
nr:bacteriohopanetetrol glucosamine biosynthesis glycosyltransferase HpnI [Candidatus Nitrosoglobus terrae]